MFEWNNSWKASHSCFLVFLWYHLFYHEKNKQSRNKKKRLWTQYITWYVNQGHARLKTWSQYASSEFRRNYFPLWVLFNSKWDMIDVCLRKRWGKCYRRCIVKFFFLAFIEWISTSTDECLWVSIWNNTFKEKYHTLRYNLSITCHFKVGVIL